MADVIGFPGCELTDAEKKHIEEFIKEELEGIRDMSCESIEQAHAKIMVLVEYFRRFMSVVEDPNTRIHPNPDLDLGLFLLEGRIKKIRGMLKNLFDE